MKVWLELIVFNENVVKIYKAVFFYENLVKTCFFFQKMWFKFCDMMNLMELQGFWVMIFLMLK